MQITPVTGLISYIQHFISMHLNIYLGNFCILDSYAHFNVRIFLLFFFLSFYETIRKIGELIDSTFYKFFSFISRVGD